jgi:hypothetical protein
MTRGFTASQTSRLWLNHSVSNEARVAMMPQFVEKLPFASRAFST